MTSRFAAEWLALREPHDLAARNKDVLAAVAASLKSAASVHVVDLACGSGASVRALRAHLPDRQHWHLVDNDPDLLALACEAAAGEVALHPLRLDLSSALGTALDGAIDLITTSALLDLVSETWMQQLLDGAAARALRIYAALSYDGRVDLAPTDPLDTAVIAAVNAHQRTDKGFGPALGPAAAPAAIGGLEARGYCVTRGRSDWQIGPAARAMQSALLAGWAGAACEIDAMARADIDGWLRRRNAALDHGLSVIRVGHVDFFAAPSPTR